jgi:type I site-specific restriction endonuclease
MVDELEWQTRRDRINKRLKALNPSWAITKYRQRLDTSRREFASFNTPKGNKFTQEYEVFSQKFRREDFEDDKPFDLIIADECHRGYTASETAVWRNVLDYFDAIKIGLTATPAPHSLSLFNEVVYRYTTEEAIEDGFLVDYDAVRLRSNVRINGVFLKEGEHVGLIDTETGREVYDQLEDEREFSSDRIERDITAPESNRKIIREIAKYAYQHEAEKGHFPKILIFAVNDLPFTSHADQIVKICRPGIHCLFKAGQVPDPLGPDVGPGNPPLPGNP